jgi:hypothetical protein
MRPGLMTIVLLLALGSVFHSCIKTNKIIADNPYGLPNATQTGANIFACRVNDSNWIVPNVYLSEIGTSYSVGNTRDSLWLFARGASNFTFYWIRFSILGAIKSGSVFTLKDSTKSFVSAEAVFLNCKPSNTYGDHESLISKNGNIQFTKFSGTYSVPNCCSRGNHDPNAIISGKFNFIVVFPGCDTIKVTEGRFDINYSQF